MDVQIQTVHFTADAKLLNHVQTKVEKMRTYFDRIIQVEVYLKLDNMSHHIKDKTVEIKVYVPKHAYFVKHTSKTFEESFEHAYDSMVNQIKRQKERMLA